MKPRFILLKLRVRGFFFFFFFVFFFFFFCFSLESAWQGSRVRECQTYLTETWFQVHRAGSWLHQGCMRRTAGWPPEQRKCPECGHTHDLGLSCRSQVSRRLTLQR